MNRREVLAALAALPAVGAIARAEVKRGDVIVLECPGDLSSELIGRIKYDLATIWPANKCVVLTNGITMKIAREGG